MSNKFHFNVNSIEMNVNDWPFDEFCFYMYVLFLFVFGLHVKKSSDRSWDYREGEGRGLRFGKLVKENVYNGYNDTLKPG